MLLRGPVVLGCLTHSRRSGMDHTVLPAITPMPAFTSKAFTRWRLPRRRFRTSNCSLLLIYQPRKDARLSRSGWLTYSGLRTVYPHKWSPVSCRTGKVRRWTSIRWTGIVIILLCVCVCVCLSVCRSQHNSRTCRRMLTIRWKICWYTTTEQHHATNHRMSWSYLGHVVTRADQRSYSTQVPVRGCSVDRRDECPAKAGEVNRHIAW